MYCWLPVSTAQVFVGGVQVAAIPAAAEGESQTLPTLNDPAGTHLFDPQARVLHIVLRGGGAAGDHQVDVIRTSAVAVTVALDIPMEEFYGDDLVNNIATLLGIDPSRIKFVGVDVEQAPSSRRRLAAAALRGTGSRRAYLSRRTTASSEVLLAQVEITEAEAPAPSLQEVAEQEARLAALGEELLSMNEAGTLNVGYPVVDLSVAVDEQPVALQATCDPGAGA